MDRGSPIATKTGKANVERLSQHLEITSGPIPAGSPRETASGDSGERAISGRPWRRRGLAEFDHRIAAQIAQVTPRARIEPLLVDLVIDVVIARSAGGRFVAA